MVRRALDDLRGGVQWTSAERAQQPALIEHIGQPKICYLRKHIKLLKKSVTADITVLYLFSVSIPNVRHHTIIKKWSGDYMFVWLLFKHMITSGRWTGWVDYFH